MFVAGASPKYLGPLVVLSVAALLGIAWHISERQGRLLAFLHQISTRRRRDINSGWD
jgi:hypothetical protein